MDGHSGLQGESTFTVSKPFFTLSFYDGKQTYEDTFSMYDIENAPTTVSADEITIDGSASSIAELPKVQVVQALVLRMVRLPT